MCALLAIVNFCVFPLVLVAPEVTALEMTIPEAALDTFTGVRHTVRKRLLTAVPCPYVRARNV